MKKKTLKHTIGIFHIKATSNNTIVTITNLEGDALLWSSSGKLGFKGVSKGTPFAAETITKKVGLEAKNNGMKHVEVILKGEGSGREIVLKTIQSLGFNILSIQDVTPVPHNGCRPPKRRRV
jgi:small subunit ribosomal protein S11